MLALNTIYCMDSVEGMKALDDNSIDSCVTDPPYGLEFMGKDWDRFNNLSNDKTEKGYFSHGMRLPNFYDLKNTDLLAFQQFTYEWATELYRVVKPGAHILIFGGTRTYHRMACSVEDAGFEVRDMVEWIYGCLSEDTEILVDGKWERYNKNIYKHHALCYDIEKDELYQGEIQRVFEYKYNDTAYRIKSDFTDQIVSRNHHCIIEQSGRKVFAKAETLECKENIPFLENMSCLQEAFSNLYKRASYKKEVLFPKMYKKRVSRKENGCTIGGDCGKSGTNLSNMRQSVLFEKKGITVCKKAFLFSKMLWKMAFGRQHNKGTLKEYFQFGKKRMDGRKQKIVSREYEWCKQSCMERWGNLFQNAWKLCWCKICEVSIRIYGNGTQRWLCDGTSLISSHAIRETIKENRSGTPQRPRPDQQLVKESSVIREQSNTQTLRERSRCKTTLATVTPFHYKGMMWCVEVPTGAFVARRNGKIFITGNSGFPKSLDISKQLDKMAGKEREVIERRKHAPNSGSARFGQAECDEYIYSNPTTEEAIQWDGWGTGLKPAHEPILLARKTISERNVASNVLKWGCGGINVDACRIGYQSKYDQSQAIPQGRITTKVGAFAGRSQEGKDSELNRKEWQDNQQGRFPANLILECCCEDDELVESEVGSNACIRKDIKDKQYIVTAYGKTGIGKGWGVVNSNEKCLIHTNPDCVCRMLDEQSGFLHPSANKELTKGNRIDNGIFGDGKITRPHRINGIVDYKGGGASRFFYQAKASQAERWFYCTICKEAYPMKERDKHIHNAPEKAKYAHLEFHPTQKPLELIKYLVRLVTPPNGIVIDPFMGTGTTAVACKYQGFRFIGFDSHEPYVRIANARLMQTGLNEWAER